MGASKGNWAPLDEEGQQLLVQWIPLVHYWVNKLCPHVDKDERDDAVQFAVCNGLIRAVQLYNPKLAGFNTYASWWLQQALRRWLQIRTREKLAGGKWDRDRKCVVGGKRIVTLSSVLTTRDKTLGVKEAGRECTLDEMADPRPLPGEEGEDDDLWQYCRGLLGCDQRGWQIVRMYYREGKTYEEIGKAFGITRERVRQLLNRSIRMIRKRVSPRTWETYRGSGRTRPVSKSRRSNR